MKPTNIEFEDVKNLVGFGVNKIQFHGSSPLCFLKNSGFGFWVSECSSFWLKNNKNVNGKNMNKTNLKNKCLKKEFERF